MTGPDESWVLSRAETYFREFEQLLLDLTFVRSKFRKAMQALADAYRRQFRRGRLVLYCKFKPPCPEVAGLYWGTLCRLPKLERGARGNPNFCRWIRHLRGPLTRDKIFFAGALDHQKEIWEFDRRVRLLHPPNVLLSMALVQIEKTMAGRGERRRWESGDLGAPAPLVSFGLSHPSRRALGGLWQFLIRMALVEAVLLKMVDRYRENPAHQDFRMIYKRGKAYRYGRVFWRFRGKWLSQDEHGSSALSELRLKSLGIPRGERPGLLLHDRALRRMNSLHRRYIRVLGRMKKRGGMALAKVAAGSGPLD
jgi:hypothetical protein